MRAILQGESNECGLACLAMVSTWHKRPVELHDIRRRFSASLKGMSMLQMVGYASNLGFAARAVRLELDEIGGLQLPCILHWDLDHFVVLKAVRRNHVVILDPAVGMRKIARSEFGAHFTGVALELTPREDFVPEPTAPRASLRRMTGAVRGLWASLGQILTIAAVLELFALCGPLVNQLVVDEAISAGDSELLAVIVIGFALMLLTQTVLSLVRSWMIILLGQSVSLQWRGNVFAHLVRLPVEFFQKRHLGDISSRFASIGSLQKTLTTSVVEAVLDGLMAFGAVAMMYVYSPKLLAVSLSAVALYALLRWASYGIFRQASLERLILAAKESSHFLETIRAITPLKLFGRHTDRQARWQNLVVDVQNRDVQTAKLSMVFGTLNTFIFGFESLMVLWLGANVVMTPASAGGSGFTIGMLFAYMGYRSQFASRVSGLIDYSVELKMLTMHTERLSDIVLTEREKTGEGEFAVTNLAHLQPSIELRNVSFRFAEGEPYLLKDACLSVKAMENVAITGPSGVGKTTLLKLLLGLLTPTEGEVLFGGVPYAKLGLENVRALVGSVMQDDVMLTGNLAENISFFDSPVDMARVELCARIARIHDEIARMPMGFQTMVGDLGAGLSGGQKQRVLLARALYRRPSVLMLDEATSHLDVSNERAVATALKDLRITRIVIAHRAETIHSADRVVELRNRTVVDVSDSRKQKELNHESIRVAEAAL
jgi:ATP-binding cassette subfamily B protein RaxB